METNLENQEGHTSLNQGLLILVNGKEGSVMAKEFRLGLIKHSMMGNGAIIELMAKANLPM
jgi:hypothetical protein